MQKCGNADGIGRYAKNSINRGNVTAMKGSANGVGRRDILNCCNYGDVTGQEAGGINTTYNAEIYNCFNAGKISGTDYAFGIGNGSEYHIMKNCYNLGTIESVSGTSWPLGDTTDGSTITNCHALTGSEDAAAKEALLNALNANRDDTTTWSEWTIVGGINNGYPIFVWENVEE